MRQTMGRLVGVLAALSLAGMALIAVAVAVDEVGGGELTWAVGAMLLTGVGVFGSLALGPVGRGIGRLIEGDSGQGDALRETIHDLEDRVHELTIDTQRLAEVEDRLEFTERLLARQSGEVEAR